MPSRSAISSRAGAAPAGSVQPSADDRDRDEQDDLRDLDDEDGQHLRREQVATGQRRAAEPLEDAVVPFVGRRDPEVDQAGGDDREGQGSRKQEVDGPSGTGRQDARRGEEEQHDRRDDDRDQDVLAPARGEAELGRGLGEGRGDRRGRTAHGVLPSGGSVRAVELEVDVLERSARRAQLADESLARRAPRRQGCDQDGIRRDTLDPVVAGVGLGREHGAGAHGGHGTREVGPLGRIQRSLEPEPQSRLRAGRELARRPGRDDPAAVQDAHAVGHPLDVGQVVAGQEDRHAGVAQAGDDRPGRGPALGIHAGGRLVEDDHLGPADEGERQARAVGARRRTAVGYRVRATARSPTRSSSSSGSRGSAWNRPYWTRVSRGWARGSIPPPWSIRPDPRPQRSARRTPDPARAPGRRPPSARR